MRITEIATLAALLAINTQVEAVHVENAALSSAGQLSSEIKAFLQTVESPEKWLEICLPDCAAKHEDSEGNK